LISAGNPTTPNTSTGKFSQTGAPALSNVQPDGQLKLLPGTAGGAPATVSSSTWNTSHTAWANTNNVASVNGSAVSASIGSIAVGVDQVVGNQLCIDLQGANPN